MAATVRRSPCALCAWGMESKEKTRCYKCAERIAYVDSLQPGPECRSDPAYQMDYTTPAAFRSQLRTGPISSWDLSF